MRIWHLHSCWEESIREIGEWKFGLTTYLIYRKLGVTMTDFISYFHKENETNVSNLLNVTKFNDWACTRLKLSSLWWENQSSLLIEQSLSFNYAKANFKGLVSSLLLFDWGNTLPGHEHLFLCTLEGIPSNVQRMASPGSGISYIFLQRAKSFATRLQQNFYTYAVVK